MNEYHTEKVSRGVTPEGFRHRWRLIFHIECSHELWNETERAPRKGGRSEKEKKQIKKQKKQKKNEN